MAEKTIIQYADEVNALLNECKNLYGEVAVFGVLEINRHLIENEYRMRISNMAASAVSNNVKAFQVPPPPAGSPPVSEIRPALKVVEAASNDLLPEEDDDEPALS